MSATETIGDRLKRLSNEKYGSQKKAAAAWGITQSQLTGYIKGKNMTVLLLTQIAESLGVTTDYLLCLSDNPNGEIARTETQELQYLAEMMNRNSLIRQLVPAIIDGLKEWEDMQGAVYQHLEKVIDCLSNANYVRRRPDHYPVYPANLTNTADPHLNGIVYPYLDKAGELEQIRGKYIEACQELFEQFHIEVYREYERTAEMNYSCGVMESIKLVRQLAKPK